MTNGTIQDSHGKYIAAVLTEMGFEVKKIALIPDDISAAEELRSQITSFESVILTGGLGPTSDDITRELLADVAGADLVFRADVWGDIAARFDVGKQVSNKRQAYVPETFAAITNKKGTAPGLRGSIKGALVFALPGPPHEMRTMFDRDVVPDLQRSFHVFPGDYLEATCFLVCESGLEDACNSYKQKGVVWGTRAGEWGISLYLRGGSRKTRSAFLVYLQDHFGKERIKEGAVNASVFLLNLLQKEEVCLASAESCTGGLFSKMITDIPGSSTVFTGGVTSYTSAAKAAFLGLAKNDIDRFGAVSKETAAAMAHGIQKRSGSDFGIAFTGIAGPGGGSDTIPVGTVWIGIAGSDGDVRTFPFLFRGSRSRIRQKAVLAGFLLLEIWVTEKKRLDSYLKWQYI